MRYHNFNQKDLFYDYYDDYNRGFTRKTIEEKREFLTPFIEHLKKADEIIHCVLYEKASLRALSELSALLKEEKSFDTEFYTRKFSLAEHKKIEEALFSTGLYDTSFDIRRTTMKMPAWYLCEAKTSYYGNYGIIIADYYRSENYKNDDPRFVRLMNHGHEVYFIRMSPFRDDVMKMTGENNNGNSRKTDMLLQDIGHHFLQYVWHEDQVIGWKVSEHFGLPRFREAMELIYFNLGADFCDVRQHINDHVKQFFSEVYNQEAMVDMISRIEKSEGSEFKGLEMKSRRWYSELNTAVQELLQVKVDWGLMEKTAIPLYKVVFSNIFRLDMISKSLKNEEVAGVSKKVERTAVQAIEDILG